jgi:hypothetical protein
MSKEPGELAYEAHETQYANQPDRPWLIVGDAERAVWVAVESAIRADERAKVIEECAKVAESQRGLSTAWDTHKYISVAIRAKGAEHG